MDLLDFKRVIEELCELIGFDQPDLLVRGGKLRIDQCLVSFFCDKALSPDDMFVYIDMGPAATETADAYKSLLKINFELGAGARGVLCVHPENSHLFYSFAYTLNENATGQYLLDSLVRFIGDFALTAMRLPEKDYASDTHAAQGSRANAARLMAANSAVPRAR
jgi:hypothetical protein